MRDDDGSRWRSLATRRRPVLKGLGALGVASAVGMGTSVASADTDDEWEVEADERIQKHRTVDFEVIVTDVNGTEVDGAEVDVAMRDHEFGFGTAVNAGMLIEGTDDDDEVYREHIPELFNKAVLENQHKWNFFEGNQELADEATQWLLEQGLAMRGHTCLWANVSGAAVPSDVVEAMGVEWAGGGVTDPELDPEHVRQRSFDHLRDIIEHYGDDIDEWDVVNEVFHEPSMIEAIDGEEIDTVEAPVLAEWYHEAVDLRDEFGVGIDVNDYNTLEGPYEHVRDDYQRQIEFLQDEGVTLDGIGLQCHFNETESLDPDEIMDGLDLYAQYDTDIRVTEFDTSDDDWDDEEKGEFLRTFLKCVFSHPSATDFLMWGFWDGNHWLGDAPLFYENWEEKPAYEAYTNLVFDEWWTDKGGETTDGRFELNGFKGEYEITAQYDGVEETATATVLDEGETVEIQLDIDEDESANGDREDPTEEEPGDDTGVTDDEMAGFGAFSVLSGLSGLTGYLLLRRNKNDE